MSYQMVWKHFREHVQVNVRNGQIVIQQIKPEEDYISVLQNLMEDLRRMITDLKNEPTNQSTVKMKTELVREIRGLIRDLCTLEGTIKRGPLIQLNQLNVQFEFLIAYLATNLCDECKHKVTEYLEKMGFGAGTKTTTGQSSS